MQRKRPGTILIADDDAGASETLADVLASEGFMVRTVGDGLQALEIARRERFDVALVDHRMPGADGLKIVRALRDLKASRRVYVLTAYAERDFVAKALAQGADHVLVKPVDIPAILQMLRGDLEPTKIGHQEYVRPQAEGLTPCEMQVLALIAQGKHNREIADELALSSRTVERHVATILERLGVSNRAAAAALAIRRRLV